MNRTLYCCMGLLGTVVSLVVTGCNKDEPEEVKVEPVVERVLTPIEIDVRRFLPYPDTTEFQDAPVMIRNSSHTRDYAGKMVTANRFGNKVPVEYVIQYQAPSKRYPNGCIGYVMINGVTIGRQINRPEQLGGGLTDIVYKDKF